MKKTIIILALVFVVSNIVEARVKSDKYSKAEYIYFTQGKNITNLNTQLPAKKGLSGNEKNNQIKSVGNYQKKEDAPRTHLDVRVRIELRKNILEVFYNTKPNLQNINWKIPISQQLFQEAISETHVYLVFPKKLIITNEMQSICAIDNITEKNVSLSACSSENTELSKLLRKYNAFKEGTHELTKDERTQLERTFDNVTDSTGKYGKIAKWIKTGIKWSMKKQEKKRILKLQEKYGSNYVIYKIPFYVPEGISMSYSHTGRVIKFLFDTSKLDRSDKIFVEIPRLSFEVNTAGAIRRASLEELAYEITVEPYTLPEPDYTVESLYGEWEEVISSYHHQAITKRYPSQHNYINRLTISKNRIQQQQTIRGKIVKTNECGIINQYKNKNTEYIMRVEDKGTSYSYFTIISCDIITYEESTFKRVGTQEKVALIDQIVGTWEFIAGKSDSVKIKIYRSSLFFEKTSFSTFFNKLKTTTSELKIIKTTKIDNVYFIKMIYAKKGRHGKIIPQIFTIKIKNKNIIYISELSIQLRRQTSYQTQKPKNPVPIGFTTLTYIREDCNIMRMELKNDGTFSTGNEQIEGDYKVKGISGRYKVKGDTIILTTKSRNTTMKVKIKDNFLIDSDGTRWIRVE
ncbi:hypothetical protein KAT36_02985 [Candidatus Pacearchaeota archaeon]|nr:hypothetical protein [Candidatus Pacearchaeota archaeon]